MAIIILSSTLTRRFPTLFSSTYPPPPLPPHPSSSSSSCSSSPRNNKNDLFNFSRKLGRGDSLVFGHCRPLPSYRCTSGGGGHYSEDDGDHRLPVSRSNSFTKGVEMFNRGDYYGCHHQLEEIWNEAQEPARTLVHGILQCAVGFHHLFNQNHKGAMMELGEGVCKLRKMNLDAGPFHLFERDISALLDFIYHTQLEHAACSSDYCLTMDQSEKSYQLLGGYGAGESLYHLEIDSTGVPHVVFRPNGGTSGMPRVRVKLPVLQASEDHLIEFSQC